VAGVRTGVSPDVMWKVNYHNTVALNDAVHSLTTSSSEFGKRSAAAFISSISASLPVPMIREYGASKTAVEYYARCFGLRNPHIDVAIVRPGTFESRSLSNEDRAKLPKCTIVSTAGVASAMLVHLQNGAYNGHWKHVLIQWLLNMFPGCSQGA